MRKRLKKKLQYVSVYAFSRECIHPAEGGVYVNILRYQYSYYVRNPSRATQLCINLIEENLKLKVRDVLVHVGSHPGTLHNSHRYSNWQYR